MDKSDHTPNVTELPTLALDAGRGLSSALSGLSRANLEKALARGITSRRWFGSKARSVRAVRIVDSVATTTNAWICLVEVEFDRGQSEVYQLPLAMAVGSHAQKLIDEAPSALWARVERDNTAEPAVLYDPLVDPQFCHELLSLFDVEPRLSGDFGELIARRSLAYESLRGDTHARLDSKLMASEQSNSSVIFGDRLILKMFRRVETGLNPDVELSDYLTRRGFTHIPPLAGTLEYRRGSDEPWALAMLQGFVPNQGDAWQYFLKRLGKFIEEVRHIPAAPETPPAYGATLLLASDEPVPPAIARTLTPHLNDAEQLGVRTAEMHLALAAATDEPELAPEPLTAVVQRAISRRALAMARETFELLRRERSKLSGDVGESADRALAVEQKANEQLARLADEPIAVERIRCHGDYHLGQVLATGDDFVIIDFEGEPARPLAERREKQLAMRDVAGMIRSFHYASRTAVANAAPSANPSERRAIDAWAVAWYFWSAATFLRAYRRTAGDASFLPRSPDPFARVLEACLLEKAVYELKYELNNRPAWVHLPLAALADLLSA